MLKNIENSMFIIENLSECYENEEKPILMKFLLNFKNISLKFLILVKKNNMEGVDFVEIKSKSKFQDIFEKNSQIKNFLHAYISGVLPKTIYFETH